jgi:hypothetical protein
VAKPKYGDFEDATRCYSDLISWYDTALKDPVSGDWIAAFNAAFPGNTYTDIKRLDFILWQIR